MVVEIQQEDQPSGFFRSLLKGKMRLNESVTGLESKKENDRAGVRGLDGEKTGKGREKLQRGPRYFRVF